MRVVKIWYPTFINSIKLTRDWSQTIRISKTSEDNALSVALNIQKYIMQKHFVFLLGLIATIPKCLC